MSLNIFMLDKNIVSLIQSKNDGKTKTKDQIEMLQLLKRHDKSIYRFSSLSSAFSFPHSAFCIPHSSFTNRHHFVRLSVSLNPYT